MTNPLIDSLTSIIEQRPEDHALREYLAELLIAEGRSAEAVSHLAVVLAVDPHNERVSALMRSALGAPEASAPAVDGPTAAEPETAAPASYEADPLPAPEEPAPSAPAAPDSDDADIPAIVTIHPEAFPQTAEQGNEEGGASAGEAGEGQDAPASPDGADPENFDWKNAEKQVGGPAPAFVKPGAVEGEVEVDEKPEGDAWAFENVTSTLADVGGMQSVKDRLTMAFLAPLRNPEIRKLYGKSLNGGLLLYGPPGCGKTYIARALAGELGAAFMNVKISDVMARYFGESEANLHELFETARANAPVVFFLDEIDAIGMRRADMGYSGMRSVTNQLLMELDGIGSDNEGVFVLAATNTPWDVDPALRRPGRFDRSIAVLPPDGPARQAVLYHHLKSRPVEGIDLGYLVQRTNGFTGADLAHLVDSAVEYAMMDSVRTGNVRMVTMQDFLRALEQIRPSAGPWFVTARNIVEYGNREGEYNDLAEYMKANNLM